MMSATTQSYIGHAAVMAGHSASISLTFFRLKKTKERPCDSESHVHISDRRLTFLRLPVELLSQIFAYHFLTGFIKSAEKLSQLSTQIRLVCRLWDAVIISTPSLWVQLRFRKYPTRPRIPPDVLSIWLQRSKTCPLHIELDCYGIDPQCLSVFTSSVERWESLILFVYERFFDLVHQHIPLSCARRLKFLCVSNTSPETPKRITALIGTAPNLQSLCTQVEFDEHCATIRSITPIINNLSRLHLGFCALDCECTWGMLQHFRGTLLHLSSGRSFRISQEAPTITFLNLKILHIEIHVNDILRLLSLLDAPTLQILDLYFAGFISVEQLINRSFKLKFPLLALRIASSTNAHGLDRFLQSPDIQAIPLVEVGLSTLDQKIESPRSCVLGVAVWVEHWMLGNFVGWNRLSDVPRDIAGYLFGEMFFSCGCFYGSRPFMFLLFEEMKKANNIVTGNGNRWWFSQDEWFSEKIRTQCRRRLAKRV